MVKRRRTRKNIGRKRVKRRINTRKRPLKRRQSKKNRLAGINDREHIIGLRKLQSKIGDLRDMRWGEYDTPDIIRDANIHARSKDKIDDCSDNCKKKNNTRRCYQNCVQDEIDTINNHLTKDFKLRRVDRFLKTKIPSYLKGKKIDALQKTNKGQKLSDTNPMIMKQIRDYL